MAKKKIISLKYFPSFQDKDGFFEMITREEDAGKIIANQLWLLILFSFAYGLIMGAYNGWVQALAAGIKVPILFLLALLICFPAFYIVQYILGSKFKFSSMLAIILSGFVLISAIMISFAPIVVFFLITGGNYAFLKLLHVGIFSFAGIFGMHTINEALKYSCDKKKIYPKTGVQIFRFWVIILAFVGMQLAWTLRPFLGAKDYPFQVFRKQQGNFYMAVLGAAGELFESEEMKRRARDKRVREKQEQIKKSDAEQKALPEKKKEDTNIER
jgi:hypothetical protein